MLGNNGSAFNVFSNAPVMDADFKLTLYSVSPAGGIVAGAKQDLPDRVKDFSRGGYAPRGAALGKLNGDAISPELAGSG
jgi:hypothetical protein